MSGRSVKRSSKKPSTSGKLSAPRSLASVAGKPKLEKTIQAKAVAGVPRPLRSVEAGYIYQRAGASLYRGSIRAVTCFLMARDPNKTKDDACLEAMQMVPPSGRSPFGYDKVLRYQAIINTDDNAVEITYSGVVWTRPGPNDNISKQELRRQVDARFAGDAVRFSITPIPKSVEQLESQIKQRSTQQGVNARGRAAKIYRRNCKRAADDERFKELRAKAADKKRRRVEKEEAAG